MKAKKLFLPLLLLFAMFSCSEPDNTTEKVSPTSQYDDQLGDYVATNFYEYDFQWVDQPTNSTGRVAGVSPGQEIRLGSDPYGSLEVDGMLPSGTVLTGVGARVNTNRNVSTLTLEYRYLNNDGSLGPRYRLALGSEPQQTPTEVWYAVPEGSVVTGVGFRAQANNMETMWVYHRPVTALSDGSLVLTGAPSEVKVGSSPTSACEALYTPNFGGTNNDKAVITGVGLRCDGNSNIVTMKILASFMQP